MKPSELEKALHRVVAEFKRSGLILESDPRLPSVTGLVVGKPLKGSWWGHPLGLTVWRVLREFCNRRDVLATKLVSGKVTFVHRNLWPEVLAVATSRESWQLESLSSDAKTLLGTVGMKGKIRTDAPHLTRGPTASAARELEQRLLVQSEEVHTERGRHAKVLRSWKNWSKEVGFTGKLPGVTKSKMKLESAVERLNAKHSADGRLPWAGRTGRASGPKRRIPRRRRPSLPPD